VNFKECTLIAADPGGMTGIASLTYTAFDSLEMEHSSVTGFVTGMLDYHKRIQHPVILGAERFIEQRSGKHSSQPHAQRIIGALEEAAKSRDIRFELQNTSDAKTIGRDSVLKRLGWYRPATPHGNDAARHLLLMINRIFPDDYARLLLAAGYLGG